MPKKEYMNSRLNVQWGHEKERGKEDFTQDFFKSPVTLHRESDGQIKQWACLVQYLPTEHHKEFPMPSYMTARISVLTTAIAMEYTLVRQMYKHFS